AQAGAVVRQPGVQASPDQQGTPVAFCGGELGAALLESRPQGGCVILCVLIHEVSGVRGVRLMERNALGYPGFARGAGRAVPRPYRGALAWGLMVLLGLTGGAGAKAPAPAEQQAGEAPPAAAQLAHAAPASFDRPPVVPPLVQPVVPPAARQAVQDAYDAAQRKRWATVDQLAPLA